MALRKYDKEWLEELCAESYSLAEVLRKAGRKQAGGSQQTLKNKIAEAVLIKAGISKEEFLERNAKFFDF